MMLALTGAAVERWDVAWPASTDPDAHKTVVGLTNRTVAVAEQARDAAALADDPDVAVVVGSLCGLLPVTEHAVATLHERGHRWLNPEAFLLNNANGLASTFATRGGIRASASTLLGWSAGIEALASAARMVELGRHRAVIAGAFDWPSPFVASWLQAWDTPTSPDRAAAAFVVVESAAAARDRGQPALGLLEVHSPAVPAPTGGADPDGMTPAVAPLVEVAGALLDRRRTELTFQRPAGRRREVRVHVGRADA